MERCEKRVELDFSGDRISSLPDCLLDCILAYLGGDFDAVVRTSVLSKRWKSCWKRVRKLDFNMDFTDKYAKQRGLDVVSIVDSVISRHDGPVDRFSLSADFPAIKSKTVDVCKWIQLLSEKGIQEISFYVKPSLCLSSPSHISNGLTLMHLNSYFFGGFGGFTNLVYLHLGGVTISGSLLEAIICSSPLISYLDLMDLEVEDVDEDFYPVTINAPRLQSLSLKCDGKLCLNKYPNLTSACFTRSICNLMLEFKVPMVGCQRTCKMDKFVQVMPRVERLMLDEFALNSLIIGDIPMKLQTTLQFLKELEFKNLDILRSENLSCLLCLIRSSPNLRSIAIHVGDILGDEPWEYYSEDLVTLYEAQKNAGILSFLAHVKFDQLLGTEYEIMMIKTFLDCCPMVETVTIVCSEHIEFEKEVWLSKELSDLWLPESATMIFQSQWEEKTGHPVN